MLFQHVKNIVFDDPPLSLDTAKTLKLALSFNAKGYAGENTNHDDPLPERRVRYLVERVCKWHREHPNAKRSKRQQSKRQERGNRKSAQVRGAISRQKAMQAVTLHLAGESIEQIASKINRAPSTVGDYIYAWRISSAAPQRQHDKHVRSISNYETGAISDRASKPFRTRSDTMALRAEIKRIDKRGKTATSIATALGIKIRVVYRHRKWIREHPEFFRKAKKPARRAKRKTKVDVLAERAANEPDVLRRTVLEMELMTAQRRSEGGKKAAETCRRRMKEDQERLKREFALGPWILLAKEGPTARVTEAFRRTGRVGRLPRGRRRLHEVAEVVDGYQQCSDSAGRCSQKPWNRRE